MSTPQASFLSIRIAYRHQNGKIHIALGLGIIRFELMTSTTSRWHSTAELYPFPCPYREKKNWLILSQKVEKLNATIYKL